MSYNRHTSAYSSIRAFSFVDLLIGIGLAGVLILGAITVATKTTVAYTKTAEMVKMSEIARFVFDYIGHRVRESGYWGCLRTLDDINGMPFVNEIDGEADSTDNTFTSDRFNIYSAETRGAPIRVTVAPVAPDAPLPVSNAGEFSAGETVLIADCEQGDIANIISLNSDRQELTFETPLGTIYGTNSFVYPIETRSIRITGNGLVENSTQFANDTVLVENVERLNMLYGIDTDDNGVANQYVKADQVTTIDAWREVVSLRVSIVVVSSLPVMVAQPMQYTFAGTVFQATDRRYYQVYTTTIVRRNEV